MNKRTITCTCVLAGGLWSGLAQTTFTKITTGEIVTDVASSYGCAWGDYDRDGYIDLAVANAWGQNNSLYRNNGNGTFTKMNTGPFVTDGLDSIGLAWGDYDNDGFLDLFTTTFDPPRKDALYHNSGDGTFSQITTGPQVNDSGQGVGMAWVDYDLDGFLDLFVANSQNENDFLYRGDGAGDFTRITSGPVVTSGGTSLGCAWGDIDNDGDPDLIVANSATGQRNSLFLNEGGGSFSRIASGHIVTNLSVHVTPTWGDYDNDGDLDLVVACGFGSESQLYRNDTGSLEFVSEGLSDSGGQATGAAWGDFDNDGWLDLFLTGVNGVSHRLYRNRRDGTFEIVSEGDIANDGGGSTSCAWGDYDNDGFLDLFVTTAGSNPEVFGESNNYLYHNDGNTNHWLIVKLIGSVSNRSAIGAKVRLNAFIDGSKLHWQMREISGGCGYAQSDNRAHFGLSGATNANLLVVQWPSGIVQQFEGVAANQIVTIVEPPRLLAVAPGHIQLQGARDVDYAMEISNDLQAWTGAGLVKGGAEYVDADAGSHRVRFYRALAPSP